jgi:hypothetical protein
MLFGFIGSILPYCVGWFRAAFRHLRFSRAAVPASTLALAGLSRRGRVFPLPYVGYRHGSGQRRFRGQVLGRAVSTKARMAALMGSGRSGQAVAMRAKSESMGRVCVVGAPDFAPPSAESVLFSREFAEGSIPIHFRLSLHNFMSKKDFWRITLGKAEKVSEKVSDFRCQVSDSQ